MMMTKGRKDITASIEAFRGVFTYCMVSIACSLRPACSNRASRHGAFHGEVGSHLAFARERVMTTLDH